MTFRGIPLLRVAGIGLIGLVLVGIAAAMPLVKDWWKPAAGQGRSSDDPAYLAGASADSTTLTLPPEVIRSLGIQTGEAVPAVQSRPLQMIGQLAPDTDRLVRMRALFASQVVQIGAAEPTGGRVLQLGDKVEEGQLLAVLWSRDLGDKKSDFVDSLSQLRLDDSVLKRLREAGERGSIPERSLLEQERRVEADRIALERAERTLRSWRLTEGDIKALEAEADSLRQRGGARNKEKYKEWARMEMRAPFAGTIVEKNATVGDYVDGSSPPLFQIADFSRLTVWAYPYEEDLRTLQAVARPIRWTIRLKSDPKAAPLEGTVDQILPIIEPNQRTPILKGKVENPSGRLLSNMSVTATIMLSAPLDDVAVPTMALVEDGRDSVVFVQPDPAQPRFHPQRVAVVQRYHDVVHIRNGDKLDRLAASGKHEAPVPLKPGTRVVTAGAMELKAALEDLQAR